MNFETLKNKLFKIKKISAIEVFSNSDGKEEYHYLTLKNNKGNITILQKGYSKNIYDILAELSLKCPIILTVNHHQVLEKIEPIDSLSKEELILSLFPNINLDDFYFNTYQYTSNYHLALLRKEQLKKYHTILKQKGFSLIEISLGNLALHIIQSLITENSLSISNKHIEIEHHEIKSISSIKKPILDQTIHLKNTSIESRYLLSYAHGICFFSSQNQLVLAEEKETFTYKTLNRKLLTKGLYCILTTLLISTSLFFYFFNQNQLLESQNTIKQHDIQEYNLLKKELEKQMHLFNSLQLTQSTSTPIIDSIGNSVLNEIKLTEFIYHPIISQDDDLLETQKNILIIKGNVFPVHHLTSWINHSLKMIKKIKHIEIIRLKEYDYNAEFELMITMNHE